MPINFRSNAIRWRLVPQWVLMAGTLLYVLSRFVPCAAPKHFAPLDDSWMQVLHVAFLEHWQFGRDIVFTFGPWGFLYGGYDPATHLISVAAWSFLSVSFWQATWQASRLCFHDRMAGWLWVTAFIASSSLAGLTHFLNLDVRLSAWVLLLLLLHFFANEDRFTATQALLVVSLGLVSLIKFNVFVSAWVTVVIVTIDNVWRQRRFPWILPVFTTSLLVFWLMAGQCLSTFVPFVCNSWSVLSGYTDAMNLTGKSEAWGVTLFLAVATALGTLAGVLTWRRDRHFGMLPWAGLLFITFSAFKYGFVRNDGHVIVAWIVLLEIAVTVLAMAWQRVGENAPWVLGSTFLLVLVTWLLTAWNFLSSPEERPSWAVTEILSMNAEAPQALFARDTLLESHEKYLAEFRQKHPIPSTRGKVDIYSWKQTVVLAHGLPYHPRPVFQSYLAYSPGLAKLNTAFLRSSSAPDNILFEVAAIDDHYPALEDGGSWPELLTRYDLTGGTNSFVLLARTEVPRQYQTVLLLETNLPFGTPMALPSGGGDPIWAELDINKSWLGDIVSTLYKPPILTMKVTLHDGQQKAFRLIPGMARAGFILSPLIGDEKSFIHLATRDGMRALAGLELASFTISAADESGGTACYQSPMRLRLYRLQYPRP